MRRSKPRETATRPPANDQRRPMRKIPPSPNGHAWPSADSPLGINRLGAQAATPGRLPLKHCLLFARNRAPEPPLKSPCFGRRLLRSDEQFYAGLRCHATNGRFPQSTLSTA